MCYEASNVLGLIRSRWLVMAISRDKPIEDPGGIPLGNIRRGRVARFQENRDLIREIGGGEMTNNADLILKVLLRCTYQARAGSGGGRRVVK